jgi:hypothetical protein
MSPNKSPLLEIGKSCCDATDKDFSYSSSKFETNVDHRMGLGTPYHMIFEPWCFPLWFIWGRFHPIFCAFLSAGDWSTAFFHYLRSDSQFWKKSDQAVDGNGYCVFLIWLIKARIAIASLSRLLLVVGLKGFDGLFRPKSHAKNATWHDCRVYRVEDGSTYRAETRCWLCCQVICRLSVDRVGKVWMRSQCMLNIDVSVELDTDRTFLEVFLKVEEEPCLIPKELQEALRCPKRSCNPHTGWFGHVYLPLLLIFPTYFK